MQRALCNSLVRGYTVNTQKEQTQLHSSTMRPALCNRYVPIAACHSMIFWTSSAFLLSFWASRHCTSTFSCTRKREAERKLTSAGFLAGPCMPSPVSAISTPKLPLLPLWEKGAGGMRGQRAGSPLVGEGGRGMRSNSASEHTRGSSTSITPAAPTPPLPPHAPPGVGRAPASQDRRCR